MGSSRAWDGSLQPVTPEKTVSDRSLLQQVLSLAGSLLVKGLIVLAMAGIFWQVRMLRDGRSTVDPYWDTTPAPLVMQGGDPYIRALMRTISAAESNSSRPYSILYGGEHLDDLSQHPDLCIPIVAGPNVGDCTTAAGRYQFITTTWMEKAEEYHPQPGGLLFWKDYSFEPEYQDRVVYAWLSDPEAWGADLAQLLRDGNLEEVLWILSPTWTSLGYGIESNSMTDFLPAIYQEMLAEELQAAGS
jgi:muramidase (phage lysozyme)